MRAERRIDAAVWDGLAHARQEAAQRGDRRVGTQHLLLALLARPEGDAQRALREAGATRAECETAIDALRGWGDPLRAWVDPGDVGDGDRAVAVLARAVRMSHGSVVSDETLLVALLDEQEPGVAGAVLRYFDIGPRWTRRLVERSPGNAGRDDGPPSTPDLADAPRHPEEPS